VFQLGQDFHSHVATFREELARYEGLSQSQISIFFKDSLTAAMRPIADLAGGHMSGATADQMIKFLQPKCKTAQTTGNDAFEEAIHQLVQQATQPFLDYVFSVTKKLSEYGKCSFKTEAGYKKLEDAAFYALSSRLNHVYQPLIDAQKKVWETHNPNPLLSKKERFSLVLTFLTQTVSDEKVLLLLQQKPKQKAPPNPNPLVPQCKFFPRCNNQNCKYRHSGAPGSAPKGGVGKKRGTVTRCGYCKKRGHVEDNCFIKDPSKKQ
jgi:hypothetical protein